MSTRRANMKRLIQCFATWSLVTSLAVAPLVVPLPAHAGVHVDIWLPGPPVIVAPPPVVYIGPPVIYGSPWYGYPGGSWHRHHHGYWGHRGHGRHHGGRYRH